MEGLQAQIVSTTVGQVSQLINEATNGQINLRPASLEAAGRLLMNRGDWGQLPTSPV